MIHSFTDYSLPRISSMTDRSPVNHPLCSRYLWDLLRVGMTATASDVPCRCNLLAGTDVSYLKLYVCTHKNTGSNRFLLTTCYPIWSKTSFHNLQFMKPFFPGPSRRQSITSMWLNLMFHGRRGALHTSSVRPVEPRGSLNLYRACDSKFMNGRHSTSFQTHDICMQSLLHLLRLAC